MLEGIRVLEFVGIGPGPFAAMLLADLGADVVGIRRPGIGPAPGGLERSRPILELDLKDPGSRDRALELAATADVLIEGFRPGVMERLGLGPEECRAANPALVYARMTGWGQTGERALRAGHDLTYVAVSGALHIAARAGQPPTPTANIVGDFAGGSMHLVVAVLSALIARGRTGHGRVLDIAIVDGAAYLTSMQHALRAEGLWSDEAGTNWLDTGTPFYDAYECADGRYLAVAPLEDEFFAECASLLGLDPSWVRRRHDRDAWPRLREEIARAVREHPRDEWARRAIGTDACVAPVLDLGEALADLGRRGLVMAKAPLPRLAYGEGEHGASTAHEALAKWDLPAESVDWLAGRASSTR